MSMIGSSFSLRSARDVLGRADVRAFGAVGDGVANDTAAIQAAINSFSGNGGPVYLPPGAYKIAAPGLTLKKGTWLIGSGSGQGFQATPNDVTYIVSTETAAGAAVITASSATGCRVEGISFLGPRTSTSFNAIQLTAGTQYFTIRDVYVDGFGYGIIADSSIRGWIENIRTNLTWRDGIRMSTCSSVTVFNAFCANAGGSGTAANAAIHLTGASSDIALLLRDVDESTATARTVWVENANRVLIDGPIIFSTANGYGIQVQAPSTFVTIRHVTVKPFSTGAPTFSIDLAGSGHVLEDVTTSEPNGGGAIQDGATDTVFRNVNGKWKQPTTDGSGTPGNATINKASGKVAIAAGAAAVTVTNSLVTAASIVHVTKVTNDATLTFIKSVVPGAGSFVVTGNANATAATTIAFTVQN